MIAPIDKVRGEGNCGRVTDRGEEACECVVKPTLISSSAAFSPKLRGYEQKRHTRPVRLRNHGTEQRQRVRALPCAVLTSG